MTYPKLKVISERGEEDMVQLLVEVAGGSDLSGIAFIDVVD